MREKFLVMVMVLFICSCSINTKSTISDNIECDTSRSSTEQGLKILCPGYFYPSLEVGSEWDRVIEQAKKMPNKIYLIANPSSGPGEVKSFQYEAAINKLRLNGGRVLGYVPTGYGSRDKNLVKDDIDKWYNWYEVDGIFLDEQAVYTGDEDTYREYYTYIKSINSGLVVNNPGLENGENYLIFNNDRISDVVCHFEDTGSNLTKWHPDLWSSSYNYNNFAAFVHTDSDWKLSVEIINSTNNGWCYITNDIMDNPWDSLPDYFEEMCDYVNLAAPISSFSVENGTYSIKNCWSNNELTVVEDNYIDCKPWSGSISQKFNSYEQWDETIALISWKNNNALGLEGSSIYSGVNISLEPWNSANIIKESYYPGGAAEDPSPQKFRVVKSISGNVILVNKYSRKVLHQRDDRVVLGTYGAYSNQLWNLTKNPQ